MADSNPIYVHESLNLLICRICQHAVLPAHLLTGLFNDADAVKAADKGPTTVPDEKEASREEVTPWLFRTKWLGHLGGMDLAQLAKEASMPKENGGSTVAVKAAVQAALERCLETLDVTDWETRGWWRSAKLVETSLRPLQRLRSP